MKLHFGDNIGIDGTSIWAAATSGTEALCVQLLACILARFWPPNEATSIWVEIVESRKSELLSSNGDFDFPEISVVQATLSREQLAEWDASARAWLRTADKCKEKQQAQLRLIINNLDIEVNRERNTYESVMEAWIGSMKVVDNLTAGMAQSIHEGAALVGLSSWHLYPDMMVYQTGAKEIIQADPLIRQGGLLTVGLQSSPASDKGVSWSLPLAKLRFYGDPVLVSRSLETENQHVTIDQFMLVVLGCVAKTWPDNDDRMTTICKFFKKLWEKIKHQKLETRFSCIRYLECAATTLSSLSGEPKLAATRLVEFGIRRCHNFLSSEDGPLTLNDQLLGLNDMDQMLHALRHDREVQIRIIRTAMASLRRQFTTQEDWLIVWQEGMEFLWGTCFPYQASSKQHRWCDDEHITKEQNKTSDFVAAKDGQYITWPTID